jgi:hypothetical protein
MEMNNMSCRAIIWLMTLMLTPFMAAAAENTQPATVQLLYVQTATAYTYADGELTLLSVSPATLFFSDRPERIVGHVATDDFVSIWGEGQNNFAEDPPNAALSVFTGESTMEAVVELLEPRLEGDNLIYQVKLLSGELPAAGGANSLFIDRIGRPLTPLSYAGVARRTTRRAVYRSEEIQNDNYDEQSIDDKLRDLKKMHDQGLITDDEYNKKRQALLDEM